MRIITIEEHILGSPLAEAVAKYAAADAPYSAYASGAGLKPEEILAGATGLAAKAYGETGVGSPEAGRRADLILIDGNPMEDIAHTANICKVRIGGNEVFGK